MNLRVAGFTEHAGEPFQFVPQGTVSASSSSFRYVASTERMRLVATPILCTGRGLHPGIFALANGLAKDGGLSTQDWASWRSANDHYSAAYADPSTVDRTVYDRAINPSARSWFKRTAAHLLTGLEFYKDFIHRHDVGWRVLNSNTPRKVLYEDDVQIVVAANKDEIR